MFNISITLLLTISNQQGVNNPSLIEKVMKLTLSQLTCEMKTNEKANYAAYCYMFTLQLKHNALFIPWA